LGGTARAIAESGHMNVIGDIEMTMERRWSEGLLDDEYAAYIMKHCGGERPICNGNDLILAMEAHYLLDSFLGGQHHAD